MRGSAQPRENLGRHFREQEKSQGLEEAGQDLGWRGRPVWPEPRVVGDGVGRGCGEVGSVGSRRPREESSLCHSAGAASTASSSQQPLGVRGREGGCVLVGRQGKGWAPERWQHWGQVMESPPCPAPQHQHRWCLPMTQVSPGSWARSPQEAHHSESLSLWCLLSQRQIFKHANQNMPGLPHPPWLRLALPLDPKALCSPPRPPLCLADPQMAHLPPRCPNAPLPHPQPWSFPASLWSARTCGPIDLLTPVYTLSP